MNITVVYICKFSVYNLNTFNYTPYLHRSEQLVHTNRKQFSVQI